jgi:phospholipase D1/2
MSNANQ